jgi:hypothetical protein
LPLCLIKHCHEDIWGSGGTAPPFLTSALDGGEWSASRPGRLTPEERTPSTHSTGGWVGPRTGLDAVKRKIMTLPESNPGRPARRPSLYRLSYRDPNLTSTFSNSLATVSMRFLAFEVPCLMLIFRCSVVSKNSSPRLCPIVRNMLFLFRDEELIALRPIPSWRTTTCQLSPTSYSVYFWLPPNQKAISSICDISMGGGRRGGGGGAGGGGGVGV